jgi:transcriptional regulator with XRE-family HTH domain
MDDGSRRGLDDRGLAPGSVDRAMSTSDLSSNGHSRTAAMARAEQIKVARRAAGLTQREFADRVGTSLWVLDRIESGGRAPHGFAERVETALGLPRGWSGAPDVALDPPVAGETFPNLAKRDLLGRNLVLGVLTILVTIRFFTESMPVLPSAGNFIEILLLPILLAVALAAPVSGPARMRRDSVHSFLVFSFIAICAASVVLNTSRLAYGPVLLFLYGFVGPLVFYYSAYRLWPVGQAVSLSRLIVALGVLQFAVILLHDLPTFLTSRNPDDIVGTFGGNAYQLVFFLLVFAALVAGIATFEPERRIARFAPVIFGATFLVTFLAQYRALVVATALVIVAIGLVLRHASGKGLLVGGAVVLAFAAGLAYVTAYFPEFKFAPTLRALRSDPTLFVEERLAPVEDVASLYGDNPQFVVTGTGPGTFSSRAWRTFAEVGDPASAEGAAQPYAAKLTGGEPYRTDVSDEYVVPRMRTSRAVLGSTALTSPFSSYVALLAEVGLIGFVLLVSIYLRALVASWRTASLSIQALPRGDPLPGLALATFIAFLLLVNMAILENWWEVARVTVPSWMMLAVCTKEFAVRARWSAQ